MDVKVFKIIKMSRLSYLFFCDQFWHRKWLCWCWNRKNRMIKLDQFTVGGIELHWEKIKLLLII